MQDRINRNNRTTSPSALTDEQRERLDAFRMGHLATADANGQPHLVPVCYAAVGDAVYIVIDEKPKRTKRLKRLRNVDENARVAFLVDHYDDDWTRLEYLMIRGPAARVTDEGEFHRALEKLRERYPPYRDMPLTFEANPMIRITPEKVNHWHAAR